MTVNEYQKLAMTTLNRELSQKDILINAVMGLCGERAYKRLNENDGNSTYRNYIIDEIFNLDKKFSRIVLDVPSEYIKVNYRNQIQCNVSSYCYTVT